MVHPSIRPNEGAQLVAYLPALSASHVHRLLRKTTLVRFARDSVEFSALLSCFPRAGVVIDPLIHGNDLTTIRQLLWRCPPERIILYVDRSPGSLQAILELSRHGICKVFVHPVSAASRAFYNTVENLKASELSFELESAVKDRMAALPDRLSRVISDVFRRPYRYQSAQDIATEAAISARSLYRAFKDAEFGSPRNVLAVARVAHGLSHLQDKSLGEISRTLGYSRPYAYSKTVQRYIGAQPSKLTRGVDRADIVMSLVENLFKPLPLCRQSRIRKPAAEDSQNAPN